MSDLINLITQNGIGVVCVGFMIYFISTTLKENTAVLNSIQQTLVAIQVNLDNLSERMNNIETRVRKKKNDKDE